MKEQILAVQRMQDYIEAHLEGTIGLSDLAQVSLFSPWHSHRLFQEYTGLTPASYIRRLRLAKAALRLKKEDIYIKGRGDSIADGISCFYYSPAFVRKQLVLHKP